MADYNNSYNNRNGGYNSRNSGYSNRNGGYNSNRGDCSQSSFNDNQRKQTNESKSYMEEYKLVFQPIWISKEIDKAFVDFAEKVGKKLATPNDNPIPKKDSDRLTTSQIRNIYGEIKRIELGGYKNNKTSFLLLKPKMQYNAARNKCIGIKLFNEVFDKCYDAVVSTDENNKEIAFKNMCQAMEAIVAFHRGNGGE